MSASMAIIMISFMWSLYKNKGLNAAIRVLSVVVFTGSLWFARSQESIYNVRYVKAMIPQHSIAIVTSERAHIMDLRVRVMLTALVIAVVVIMQNRDRVRAVLS